MQQTNVQSVVRAYHDGWSKGDFAQSSALLAEDLAVEVPLNDYPTKASFAEAVANFGSIARSVRLLSELYADGEAMLLYDMDVDGLGTVRVVEHFEVADGKIARVRQIHDTAALRAAGFAGGEA